MVVMPSNFLAYVLILSSRCVCFVFQGCFIAVYGLFFGEFDPGSGRTLAACLRNASRTRTSVLVANGRVTRKQPALKWGTTSRKGC